MWTDDWIGIPYAELGRGPDSYDCLGLFVALQRVRHDRVIFDPQCTASVAARKKLAQGAKVDWLLTAEIQEGDALLFKVRGLELHVGYAIDARLMLHTGSDTGEVTIEDYRASNWGDRLEGAYRYAG